MLSVWLLAIPGPSLRPFLQNALAAKYGAVLVDEILVIKKQISIYVVVYKGTNSFI